MLCLQGATEKYIDVENIDVRKNKREHAILYRWFRFEEQEVGWKKKHHLTYK